MAAGPITAVTADQAAKPKCLAVASGQLRRRDHTAAGFRSAPTPTAVNRGYATGRAEILDAFLAFGEKPAARGHAGVLLVLAGLFLINGEYRGTGDRAISAPAVAG